MKRNPVSMTLLFLALVTSSVWLIGCPKKDTTPKRKVLAFGKKYLNWTKINTQKVISIHHGNTNKDIYSNDIAHKVFMGIRKKPYPKGSTFVVIHFNQEGEQKGFAYVMHKMGADYDPDRSNWRYTIVRVSDWTIEQDGLIASCIKCHEKAASRDYIQLDPQLFKKSTF
jgi:hypothetical protein